MATLILCDVLEYDPSSKSGLRWRVDLGMRARSGSEAGGIQNDGGRGGRYWRLFIGGKKHYAHRVVWEIVHGGSVPEGYHIDHKDGNSLNNNVDNLRLATTTLNNRNAKSSTRNTTGIVGVGFRAARNCYVSSYYELDGEKRTKSFSCDKYGKDAALELAVAWRRKAIEKANAHGAGYTERHLSGG